MVQVTKRGGTGGNAGKINTQAKPKSTSEASAFPESVENSNEIIINTSYKDAQTVF